MESNLTPGEETTMTTAKTTPTCKPTSKGFGPLPCPLCGEEATVRLDITEITEDGDCLWCGSCEADFSLATVRNVLARWSKALAWIDSMPTE